MQRADGSFGDRGYDRGGAVAALAGMAMLAAGSTPGRGPYGESLTRCVDFLLEHAAANGLVMVAESESEQAMYAHGFATLFLAEVHGMESRHDLRRKLSQAVRLIVDTQNGEGGWRYQPRRADADISVTVCQVMALRAARNAGLFVPRETIDRSIEYIKTSQNADGGFRYMLQGGQSAFPRSAAAIVALNSAGIYSGREVEQGLAYLAHYLPRDAVDPVSNHFFYGHYYAVQAMWHAGGHAWQQWYPAIRDTLTARQRDDGSWLDPVGRAYGTAMALLILQVPNGYLPIFQR
jgi:hypothetical protein